MSELKVYSQCYDGTDGLFYLKSEADKVIANRDCEIKKLNGALDQLLKAKTEQIIHEVIQNTLIYGEGFIRVQDAMKLTEHYFCKNDEFFLCGHHPDKIPENVVRPYYLKTEADKVIEDLEEKLKNSRNARKYWMKEYLLEHKECIHHKYKRCLAMAELCNEKWLVHNFEKIPTKLGFYGKWHKRWLELAEKFKEGK